MFRIPIKIIYPKEWPEELFTFRTSFIDEAVVKREGLDVVTEMLLLAPAHDIVADYKVITEIQHHEAHGAHFWQPLQELASVSECSYEGYKIQNAEEVCWKLWEHKNA
ncbi:MAG: hypothetical protein Unbinned2819contig1003_13 [Prokaryotic dsDNA virus sp.]|nr:MAG: hypothetical protein Unbinned2819contig1003_13 [Prokaryotic dsDNA virus sp.]